MIFKERSTNYDEIWKNDNTNYFLRNYFNRLWKCCRCYKLNSNSYACNGKENEIDKALKQILQPSTEYVTPKNSEQKQSVFMEDINQDGKEEAFTLYRDMKENRQVHLLMLQENNGKWNKVFELPTNFNIIDYFKIKDLDGDGKKEVILGASISDSEPKKQLFIYEWDGKELVNKVNCTYEGIDIDDYDEDKKPDLVILDGEANKLQTAEMFSYEKDS